MAKAATTAKAGSVAEAVRTMPRLKLYLINSKQASGWCPQSLMWPCYDKNASDIVDASEHAQNLTAGNAAEVAARFEQVAEMMYDDAPDESDSDEDDDV